MKNSRIFISNDMKNQWKSSHQMVDLLTTVRPKISENYIFLGSSILLTVDSKFISHKYINKYSALLNPILNPV